MGGTFEFDNIGMGDPKTSRGEFRGRITSISGDPDCLHGPRIKIGVRPRSSIAVGDSAVFSFVRVTRRVRLSRELRQIISVDTMGQA